MNLRWLLIHPINFPDELQILIFPVNQETNQPLGGNFPMAEHHNLEWTRNQYPLVAEHENRLRARHRSTTSLDTWPANF